MSKPKPELITAAQAVKATGVVLPAEAGKALAAAAPATAVIPKVKNIVEFGKHAVIQVKQPAEQSRYEQRSHLHNVYGSNPETELSHRTSHTKAELVEAILPEAKKIYGATKNKVFKSQDFVKAFKTFGPAKNDVVTAALRSLVKQGKFKCDKVASGKLVRYTYELLELPVEPTV